MDNWEPTVVYQLVVERHREQVVRGETAQRLAAIPGLPSLRERVAAGLIGLARRLAPSAVPASPQEASLSSAIAA